MTADTGTDLPSAGGQPVLLAESSAATAILVRTLLARWGFVVHAVPCDSDAVRHLAEQPFGLAIVGATGSDAPRIAAACVSAGVPVLALVTEGFRLEGSSADLSLPLNASSLRAAVDRCLSRTSADLDPAAIALLWESPDNPIYHRIVRVFIGEIATRLAGIAEAMAAGDLKRVETEAHSIKGASGNVAAHAIRDAAARVETAASGGETHAPAELADDLRAVSDRGIAALERLLAAGNGKS